MFPCIEKYIDYQFTIFNKPAYITNPKIVKNIVSNTKQVILMLQNGIKLSKFPPDVKRIEQMMLSELKADEQNNNTTTTPIHKNKNGIPIPVASDIKRPVINTNNNKLFNELTDNTNTHNKTL
jgi:hypothetical protein